MHIQAYSDGFKHMQAFSAVAYQLMVADQKQHTETNQTPQRKSSKRKSKRASTPLRKRKASKTVAK